MNALVNEGDLWQLALSPLRVWKWAAQEQQHMHASPSHSKKEHLSITSKAAVLTLYVMLFSSLGCYLSAWQQSNWAPLQWRESRKVPFWSCSRYDILHLVKTLWLCSQWRMAAPVQPEQKLKVINDSIKGKKLVNLLILSFIFFLPAYLWQCRKTTWFLFVSVNCDCSAAGAVALRILAVWVGFVFIWSRTGCYGMEPPVVTEGSVTWRKQHFTTAYLLMALVPSPDTGALSLGWLNWLNTTKHCWFETLNLFLTCVGFFLLFFLVFFWEWICLKNVVLPTEW